MAEFKPCPFCGGEARYHIHDRFGIECIECGAGYAAVFPTKADVRRAWNTRAERTCRNEDYDHDTWFKCSECRIRTNLEIMHGGYAIPNYCPNCGAKVVDA